MAKINELQNFFIILSLLFIFASLISGVSYYLNENNNETSEKDMWFDESFTALFIQKSYKELLFVPVDVHPPLYYVTLKTFYNITHKIFKNPYRAFSFMCLYIFIISNCIIYLRFTYDNTEGFLFTNFKMFLYLFFLTLLTSLQYYSTESRMYMLILSLYSLSWLFFFIFEDYNNQPNCVYFLIAHYILLSMCLLIHYYMIFGIILSLLFVFIRKRKSFENYIFNFFSIPIFLLTVMYLVWYGSKQLALMGNMWLPPVNILTVFNTWLSYFFYSSTYYTGTVYIICFLILIFMLPLINIFVMTTKIINIKCDMFVLYYLCLFIPMIGIIASLYLGVYHHRYFMFCSIFILPFFFTYLCDLLIIGYNKSRRFLIIVIVFLICGVCFYSLNKPIINNHELIDISMFLSENASDGDIIIHSSTFSMIPMIYYTNTTFDHYLLSVNVSQKQLNTAGGVIIKDRYHKIKVLTYVPSLTYNQACELLELNDSVCHHKNIFFLNSGTDFLINPVILLTLDGIRVERLRMI